MIASVPGRYTIPCFPSSLARIAELTISTSNLTASAYIRVGLSCRIREGMGEEAHLEDVFRRAWGKDEPAHVVHGADAFGRWVSQWMIHFGHCVPWAAEMDESVG